MEPSKSFKDLIVWQKAHKLVLSIYQHGKEFPKEEMFGLTSQIRRSAISVPANIAEGFTKRGKLDKMRFINIAQGSLEESKYYLILANDLGYITSKELFNQLDEVSKLMNSYYKAIKMSNEKVRREK